MPGPSRRRHSLRLLAFAATGLALSGLAVTGPGAGAAPLATDDAEPVHVDDGAAPANPLDPSLLPAGLAGRSTGKGVEALQPGTSGFKPFETRSYDFGAYRLQLVASGSDGDVELLRTAAADAAAQLTAATNITFTVDPGQVPRPTSVSRFPSTYCGDFPGHQCSLFDDNDTSIGVIRIGFSSGSPCGPLIPAGTSRGIVGCGGPESVKGDDGTIFHLRGNVWVSASLGDVNASIAPEVVAHEIGHALGLNHYEPAYTAVPGATPVRQLMYPALHDDPSDTGTVYRSGDVNGFRWLHLPEAWYITATYRDFLGRIPDTPGYQFWVSAPVTIEEYVDSLASSDEWVGRIVNDFYADVFGRAADPGGFAYWAALVRERGVPFVASQLYGSPEYLNRNGGSATGVVQAMYRELLGRDGGADPAGVQYWVDQAGQRGLPDVALAFFQSDEKRRGRVRDLYCSLLDRPPDGAGLAYWADVILIQGDLELARNLATSTEYLASADEFALAPIGAPPAPGCT